MEEGELFVIPNGIEQKTSAKIEYHAMLIEASGTVNTGDAGGEKPASSDEWI